MHRLEWKESEVKVASADERCFFLLLLTHFTKAHSEKCARMAVPQISFTWFAWKCVLFAPFVVALSPLGKQLMPAVGWQRQLCWNHADATTCNQQLCLFCRLYHMWGVVMVGVLRLVAGVMSTFGLAPFYHLFPSDAKAGWRETFQANSRLILMNKTCHGSLLFLAGTLVCFYEIVSRYSASRLRQNIIHSAYTLTQVI